MYQAGFHQLGIHKGCNLPHELFQIKRNLFQFLMAGIQFAHIQHIVDQCQQVAGGKADLIQAVIYPGTVTPVFADNIHHAHNAVDGGADIMAHTVQELCFCLACRICFPERCLQALVFFLFFFVKLGRIFKQNNTAHHTAFCLRLGIIDGFA